LGWDIKLRKGKRKITEREFIFLGEQLKTSKGKNA